MQTPTSAPIPTQAPPAHARPARSESRPSPPPDRASPPPNRKVPLLRCDGSPHSQSRPTRDPSTPAAATETPIPASAQAPTPPQAPPPPVAWSESRPSLPPNRKVPLLRCDGNLHSRSRPARDPRTAHADAGARPLAPPPPARAPHSSNPSPPHPIPPARSESRPSPSPSRKVSQPLRCYVFFHTSTVSRPARDPQTARAASGTRPPPPPARAPHSSIASPPPPAPPSTCGAPCQVEYIKRWTRGGAVVQIPRPTTQPRDSRPDAGQQECGKCDHYRARAASPTTVRYSTDSQTCARPSVCRIARRP